MKTTTLRIIIFPLFWKNVFCLATVLGAGLLQSSADSITNGIYQGDLIIQPDSSVIPPEGGDLAVSGSLDILGSEIQLGSTLQSPAQLGVLTKYYESGTAYSLTITASRANTSFLWQDNAVATLRNKMALDPTNILRLYNATTNVPGLTLNPNTGDLTLVGGVVFNDGSRMANRSDVRAQALYDAAGNVVATVAADGSIKFNNPVTFGSDPNVKLNASNVAALQSTLKNLGYSENPVTGTAIRSIALTNVTITAARAAGGFLYVAGNFSGSTAFIGGSPVSGTANGNGIVAKIAANGSVVWAKAIGGTFFVSATSVAVDGPGNVVVTGYFSGTTTTLGSGKDLTSAGSNDGFVVSYNASGAVQWAKAIGGASYDTASSAAVDGSGNVVVTGSFSGTTTTLGPGKDLTSAGSNDGFVVSYNASGAVQWAKAIGGTSFVSATSVAVDGSGNVVVTGSFSGTTRTLGSEKDLTSAGNRDGFVVSYNASGAVQWAKAIGGTSSDSATSVAVDGSGNVVVTGSFYGTTTTLGSGKNLTSAGGVDGFVVRLNSSNGGVLDAAALGGTSYDSARGSALLGSIMYVFGSAGGNMPIGNTRVQQGAFLVSYPVGSILTPPVPPPTSLAWGGSSAVGAGSVALGGTAFAEGAGSTAFGNSAATGVGSLSSGTANASGSYASALGFESRASGQYSSALGFRTTASGDYSTALGYFTTASGRFSTALGFSTTASGDCSTALGFYTTASGHSSTALGFSTTASGEHSFASGQSTTASGVSSFASGESTTASGDYSTALGYFTTASDISSFASGESTTASGSFSTAFGVGTIAQSFNSLVLGRYNIAQGNMTTWVPTDDLFVIGNGTSAVAPANAFVIKKNGDAVLNGALRIPPKGDLSMGAFTAE